jgi:hypothetical protein
MSQQVRNGKEPSLLIAICAKHRFKYTALLPIKVIAYGYM